MILILITIDACHIVFIFIPLDALRIIKTKHDYFEKLIFAI